MTNFVVRHIAPEMLGLLVVEACLAFGLSYAVVSPVIGGFDARAANLSAVAAVTVGFTSFLLGLYRPQLFLRTRSLLLSTAVGGLMAFPAVWAVSWALGMRSEWIVGPDRTWPLKILLVWIAALFALRLGMLLLVRSGLFVRRVLVAGPPSAVARAMAAIRACPAGFFEVVPAGAVAFNPDAVRRAGIRVALLSTASHSALHGEAIEAYTRAGVRLEPEPAFWEKHLKRVDIDNLTPAWFARLDARPPGRLQPLINRLGDIATSLALLLVTLPLMVLVAAIIRLDSAGPVLYRQERVGLSGVAFTLLKFRSMRPDAERAGPTWAQQRDPRATRIGAFMRRTRVDELPQLLNILRGEMSFIGPRPERPHFVEQLSELIPFYHERSRVKPGLTGWAQVNYPYGASVEDARAKLSYDLFYVARRSVLLDLSIILATVRVILFQEGAR